jgi:hypothetical protein
MFHSRGIGSKVDTGEVRVSGERVALLSVDQKPNLRDLGEIGVQRTDDG